MQAATPYSGTKARVFDLEVVVAAAQVDKSVGPGGDMDCIEFVGEAESLLSGNPAYEAGGTVEVHGPPRD